MKFLRLFHLIVLLELMSNSKMANYFISFWWIFSNIFTKNLPSRFMPNNGDDEHSFLVAQIVILDMKLNPTRGSDPSISFPVYDWNEDCRYLNCKLTIRLYAEVEKWIKSFEKKILSHRNYRSTIPTSRSSISSSSSNEKTKRCHWFFFVKKKIAKSIKLISAWSEDICWTGLKVIDRLFKKETFQEELSKKSMHKRRIFINFAVFSLRSNENANSPRQRLTDWLKLKQKHIFN